MSLTFINGRSGSGKTTKLLDILEKSIEKNKDLNKLENINKKRYIIVPDQYSYMMERKVLEKFKGKNVFSIQVVGFTELATRILENVGGIKKNVLNSIGRSILISYAQNLVKDDLLVYGEIETYSDFSNELYDSIKEFKNYNIDSDKLLETSKQIKSISSKLDKKLHDIALIYKKYTSLLHNLGLKDTDAEKNDIENANQKNVEKKNVDNELDSIENYEIKKEVNRGKGKYSYLNEEKIIDSDDKFYLAIEKLKETSFLSDGEFYIDEFNDFTPLQIEMIVELCKKRDVYITLTLDTNLSYHTGVFSLPLDTQNKLLDAINAKSIAINYIFVDGKNGRFKDNEELSFLEKEFYNYPNKTYGKLIEVTNEKEEKVLEYIPRVKNISIFKAQNPTEEIEYVAKDIIKKIRESEGSKNEIRYKDIVLLLRNLEGYENVLKSTMKEYDIPLFIDSKKDIDSNPLTTLIASYFEIIESNFSHASMFKLLKTNLVDIDFIYDEKEFNLENYDETHLITILENFKRDRIDKLENYCLANGIKGYSENTKNLKVKNRSWTLDPWENKVPNVKEENSSEILNELNEIKDSFFEKLLNSFNEMKEAKSAKEKCTVLYNYLVDSLALENYSMWIEKFSIEGHHIEAREYGEVLDAFYNVLDQLVDSLEKEEISTKDFGKLLLIGLKTKEISVIPSALDEVIAGDISRIRSSSVKAIYIIGATEGILPRTQVSNGLFTDFDREVLEKNGVNIKVNSTKKSFYEEFYIYNALTISNGTLTVTYPTTDSAGSSLRPSPIVARLKKIFPGIKEIVSQSYLRKETVLKEEIASKKHAYFELISELRMLKEGKYVDDIWKEVYKYFYLNKEYKDKLLDAERALTYSNKASKISDENAKKLYSNDLNLTASRIEKFVECPYAHFINYGLSIKERKEFKLENPEIGSLMHEVVDKFSREVKNDNISWEDLNENEVKERVEALMKSHLDSNTDSIFNSNERYNYLAKRVTNVIENAIDTIKFQIVKGSFRPIETELEFGENKTIPSLKISLNKNESLKEDKNILINGKIDRVDLYKDEFTKENYIRIIDYKSGEKSLSLDEVFYGLQMQLLIYLNVALKHAHLLKEVGENSKVIPGAMLYFKLKKPVIKDGVELDDISLQDKVRRELMLNGLTLLDPKVIKAMQKVDDPIDKKNASSICIVIPAVTYGNDVFIKSRAEKNFVSYEEFNLLQKHLEKKIKEYGEKLLMGDISITPYKYKRREGCMYCKFKAICQFDKSIEGNEYNEFIPLKKEEILEKLKKEENANG